MAKSDTTIPAVPTAPLVKGEDKMTSHNFFAFDARWNALREYIRENEITEAVALDRAVRVLLADDAQGRPLLTSLNRKKPQG